LRNFNKQHLILAKFYIKNASSISNQSARFKLNLFMQTIVIAAFVRLHQNVKCLQGAAKKVDPYSFSLFSQQPFGILI